MSYVYPDLDNVAASWVGTGAHVYPGQSDVSASWEPIPPPSFDASGWQATQFGTPAHLTVVDAQPVVTGVSFGTHTSLNAQLVTTFGLITRYGRSATPYDSTLRPRGFRRTLFGTPQATQPFRFGPENQVTRSRGARITKFGAPTT